MAANSDKNAPPKASDKSDKPAPKSSAPKAKTVRVKVRRLGFYGDRLRPVGMVFNITVRPDEKLPSWVDVVDDNNDPIAADQKSPATEQSTGAAASSDDVI